MISILVTDFDGTLTNLDVDWAELRRVLKVRSINDLWTTEAATDSSAWDLVAEQECLAARRARPAGPPRWLQSVESWSVLTNNSAKAVHIFLARMKWTSPPWSLPAPVCVFGREDLAGPKESFRNFEAAISEIASRMHVSVSSDLAYLGDRSYEVAYAKRLGLAATRVSAPL